MNIFFNIIVALPLLMFFVWRFIAARESYLEWTKYQKDSPLPYLASNAIIFTIAPLILFFVVRPGLIISSLSIAMICLGLWHFYWWYKYNKFQKHKKRGTFSEEN